MTETALIFALCLFIGGQLTEHRYQDSLSTCLKMKREATRNMNMTDKAEQLLSLAEREGYEPQQKQKVESMTLKALYRERIEAGLDMPSEFFHTFVKDQTKISRKS